MQEEDTSDQESMAIHMQSERLYSLFMQAPVAVSVVRGPEYVYELVNPLYQQLVGKDRPLIGLPLREAVPETDPEILAIIDNVYASGEHFVGKEHSITIDWDYNGNPYAKYLDFVYEPLRDAQNHVDGILTIVYDVSDRVVARQRLVLLSEASAALASLTDYETTLQAVAGMAIPVLADYCVFDMLDDNGLLRRVAQAHIDSIQSSIDESIVRYTPQLDNVAHPVIKTIKTGTTQFIPYVTDAWREEVATNPRHLELLRRLNFQSLISVPVSIRERTIGALTFCRIASHRNYTTVERDLAEELAYRAALAIENSRLYTAEQQARIQAEQRLAELAAVIDSISDAVYIGNAEGIQICNQPALSMLGFTTTEELNHNIAFLNEQIQTRNSVTHERILPEQEGFVIALRGESNVSEVIVRHLQTGEDRIIRCAASPIRHNGQILGAVAINTDVTERKRAEDERLQLLERERTARAEAEGAVRARDEFLSIAAHELKTPVTSMRGYAQLLLKQIEANRMPNIALLQRILGTIDQQSVKLGRLIDQLLDVSRLSAGRLELRRADSDVGKLALDVATSIQPTTAMHTLDVQVQGDTWVSIDALRIEQVLVNLIANAIKYSPSGGPIKIQVERCDQETVRISVTDRGIGVPPEHQAHIFEPFYQAHEGSFGGMGLGLSISQSIVNMHGGRIEASFPDEGGTRITIWLPAAVNHVVS